MFAVESVSEAARHYEVVLFLGLGFLLECKIVDLRHLCLEGIIS